LGRRGPRGYDPEHYREITVPAVRLSAYLGGPVDFLKLDIEGLETAVLREADAAGRLACFGSSFSRCDELGSGKPAFSGSGLPNFRKPISCVSPRE